MAAGEDAAIGCAAAAKGVWRSRSGRRARLRARRGRGAGGGGRRLQNTAPRARRQRRGVTWGDGAGPSGNARAQGRRCPEPPAARPAPGRGERPARAGGGWPGKRDGPTGSGLTPESGRRGEGRALAGLWGRQGQRDRAAGRGEGSPARNGGCRCRGPGGSTRRVPAALPAAATRARPGSLRLAPFSSVFVV